MFTPTISRTQDVTLAINVPALSPQKPLAVATPSVGGSTWTVTLTRYNDTLTVGVLWDYKQPSSQKCIRCPPHSKMEGYCAMHLVPCKTPGNITTVPVTDKLLQTVNTSKVNINVDELLDDDKYCFSIVISSSTRLTRKAAEPPNHRPLHRDMMTDLLKDINSVNICFVFDKEKTTSNVGLWAHSIILSKYDRFSQMILEAASSASSSKDGSSSLAGALNNTHLSAADDTEGPAMQTVLIKRFSLATFCVLLRYIYTGEVILSADTSQHAISMTERSLVLQDIARGGKRQESIRWNPLDSSSPWRLKDVAWEELLEAADYFGVAELRAQCEEAVIKGLDESKAVAMLFNEGSCFEKTKESAMQFVVKNMASMVKDGKKPFTLYKGHPACHRVMFEAMRRRTAKDGGL